MKALSSELWDKSACSACCSNRRYSQPPGGRRESLLQTKLIEVWKIFRPPHGRMWLGWSFRHIGVSFRHMCLFTSNNINWSRRRSPTSLWAKVSPYSLLQTKLIEVWSKIFQPPHAALFYLSEMVRIHRVALVTIPSVKQKCIVLFSILC